MSISTAASGLNIQSSTTGLQVLECSLVVILTSYDPGAAYDPLLQMAAPKVKFRPSRARATLIAFIVILSVLVFFAAPAQAQCNCRYGVISYSHGARCWYGGTGSGQYVTLPYNARYDIYCQRTGPYVSGNNWWNRLRYNGRYCYVNDYYMRTGCPNRCYNLRHC